MDNKVKDEEVDVVFGEVIPDIEDAAEELADNIKKDVVEELPVETEDKDNIDIEFKTVGEFFGTLQQSVITIWRAHLATKSYAAHIAMNEYYESMLDKVDGIIECYQGINGIVSDYRNVLAITEPVDHLEKLRELVRLGREMFCSTSELESCCDDILSQINSTIYKLKNLK